MERGPVVVTTVKVACPGSVSAGTRKLICLGETKYKGAVRLTCLLSRIVTETPAMTVGRFAPGATAVVGAIESEPTTDAMDPGLMPHIGQREPLGPQKSKAAAL